MLSLWPYCIAAFLYFCPWVGAAHSSAAEPRQALAITASPWARAIVRLEVPVSRQERGYARHFTEHCSAIVISPEPNPLLVSAWHCFDGYPLVAPAIPVFHPEGGLPLHAELLDTGGSMAEDWAILRITTAVTDTPWIPISKAAPFPAMPIIAAGYAPLAELAGTEAEGTTDRALVADYECMITKADVIPYESNCLAKKGSSGGAAVSLSPDGTAKLVGIISSGDGKHVSYFYPAVLLLDAINNRR